MDPGSIPHERIRDLRDRSWTLPLLALAQAEDTPEEGREEAFLTLAWLSDPRATSPCDRYSRTPAARPSSGGAPATPWSGSTRP
ncbi:MAG: hypothetical protein ACRDKW_00850 [Actinomycetota bacterium]